MQQVTRWVSHHPAGHAQAYIERFRRMAAEGTDLAGEARLLDAMIERQSRVLDAGCGPGRVGAFLAASGHTVVGADADPELIVAAQQDYPGPHWLVADLSTLDLAAHGEAEPFDAAIVAGNVMLFVAPDTEHLVVERIAAHVRPDGVIVFGFSLDRSYDVAQLDADAQAAGLIVEHRFATWDLRPWSTTSDYAVTVLRVPLR